jgi:4-hydroxy 2-oxovalerate aldolase
MRTYLLDCTLRDGGYQNEWNFGYRNICKIAQLLTDARIDIIECGFLSQKIVYDADISKFTTIEQINAILPSNRNNSMYVVMMNHGEADPVSLPECNGSGISGIRVAFHKKDLNSALEECEIIKSKGYKVFIQAMVSLSYSDSEILSLVDKANEIEPYAFYIVDSFGSMSRNELLRLFYLVEHNLSKNIKIGFHSHNNLQLAYSNAILLTEQQSEHNLIIDASVYGMGRGAGNLNLELFAEHINAGLGGEYEIDKLLIIIDEFLNKFYKLRKLHNSIFTQGKGA